MSSGIPIVLNQPSNSRTSRGFIPDSGVLQHLRLPLLNEDVRVDAGFIAGDEVSSHYDPMISKLIVRGSDRTEAIQKLKAALEDYEIAGPVTNIEFLKRVCENSAFIAGEVETGFIKKHESQLMQENPIPSEVYAQCAVASLLREESSDLRPVTGAVGFMDSMQKRQVRFTTGPIVGGKDVEEVAVEVSQIDGKTYDVHVNGTEFPAVRSVLDPQTSTLTSFFRHTRLDSRIIFSDEKITIFSRGKQYCLRISTPKWLEKVLGVKDLTHSVLAPMPCKILRVEVTEGDEVKKDQALVVIESMKMETVIRSPQDGVIAKLAHREGVRYSALVDK